jgi:hypothetical protein
VDDNAVHKVLVFLLPTHTTLRPSPACSNRDSGSLLRVGGHPPLPFGTRANANNGQSPCNAGDCPSQLWRYDSFVRSTKNRVNFRGAEDMHALCIHNRIPRQLIIIPFFFVVVHELASLSNFSLYISEREA